MTSEEKINDQTKFKKPHVIGAIFSNPINKNKEVTQLFKFD